MAQGQVYIFVAIIIMGNYFTTLWDRLLGNKRDYRLLMLGLDAAGKTTVLYKLKLGEVQTTIPTIGFNVEQVDYHNIHFTVWDVGGQDKLRPLWRHYYQGTEGLIFVIDSNDVDPKRVELAKMELTKLLMADEMQSVSSVLILANKQDLPQAMSASVIMEKMDLPQLFRQCNRRAEWFIQPCCAVNGQGLYEGLDWLAKSMSKRTTA